MWVETCVCKQHRLSSSPNRKNFYLLSTVPVLLGFKSLTWNFSEKAHGKGAPDGVGATAKRIADTAVQRGKDLKTPEQFYDILIKQKSTINFFWVSKEDVEKFDEKVPEVVPADHHDHHEAAPGHLNRASQNSIQTFHASVLDQQQFANVTIH